MGFLRGLALACVVAVPCLAAPSPSVAQDTTVLLYEDPLLPPERLNYPLAISDGRGFRILCNSRSDEEKVIRGLGFVSVPSEVRSALDPEIVAADPAANPFLCPKAANYPIRFFAHDSGEGIKHYLQFPAALGSAEFIDRIYVPGCVELLESLNIDLDSAIDSDPVPFFSNRIHEITCIDGNRVPGGDPETFAQWCEKGDLTEGQRATVIAVLEATPGGAAGIGRPQACALADAFLHSVNSLNLNRSGIRSLEPLAPLTHLIGLSLSGNSITDLEPLAHLLALTRLDLSDNAITGTAALSPLVALLELNLSHNQIVNVRPLSSLVALAQLDLSDNPLADIEPLQLMPGIQGISISGTKATGIAPLMRLPNLQQASMRGLELRYDSIAEYCFVHKFDDAALGLDRAFMTALDSALADAEVDPKDCRAVETWATPLRELGLSNAELTSIRPIRFFPELRAISLADNSIADAGPLTELTQVTKLDLSGNRLSNLPAFDMPGLKALVLARNNLTDVTVLSGLSFLLTVDLSDNQISTAAQLGELGSVPNLDLRRNRIATHEELLKVLSWHPHLDGNPACAGAAVTEAFDWVADDIFSWAPALGLDPFNMPELGAADVRAACGLREATDIYAITDNGEVRFYRHYGFADGSADWWPGGGLVIGTDWNYSRVLAGPEGSLYAINADGSMFFYRHLGFHDGAPDRMPGDGVQIGSGWATKHVFAGAEGAIYSVDAVDDLNFFRHFAFRGDANAAIDGWQEFQGLKVGNGWNFKQLFGGDGGAIYAITFDGDLLYYRHFDFLNGTADWFPEGGKKIGNGWNFEHVFAGPQGSIYAVNSNGDMLFYKHFGYLDGSNDWWSGSGTVIGTGWKFRHITARR